jgi:hypothetical protein
MDFRVHGDKSSCWVAARKLRSCRFKCAGDFADGICSTLTANGAEKPK